MHFHYTGWQFLGQYRSKKYRSTARRSIFCFSPSSCWICDWYKMQWPWLYSLYFPSSSYLRYLISIFFFFLGLRSIYPGPWCKQDAALFYRKNNVFTNTSALISFHVLHAVLLARNITQRSPQFSPLILQGLQPLNLIPACCRIIVSPVSLYSALSTPYSVLFPVDFRARVKHHHPLTS